jgi:hypothetical protein
MVFFIFCPSAIYKPFFWQPENRLITICCVSPTSSKQSLWQNLFLGSETHQTWENYLLLDFSGYTRGHKELHEDNLYTYVPNLNISGYIYRESSNQSQSPMTPNHSANRSPRGKHQKHTRNRDLNGVSLAISFKEGGSFCQWLGTNNLQYILIHI